MSLYGFLYVITLLFGLIRCDSWLPVKNAVADFTDIANAIIIVGNATGTLLTYQKGNTPTIFHSYCY
jgi:hypothetical protein